MFVAFGKLEKVICLHKKDFTMYNNSRGFLSSIPPVTKNLLLINILMWIATMLFPQLNDVLGLHYWSASKFNPAQLVTYMFVHGGFTHMFFNMFSLFMFGGLLEQALGRKRYLFYYISCGIGAAIVQEVVTMLTLDDMFKYANAEGFIVLQGAEAVQYAMRTGEYGQVLNNILVVGASGAIFGILLAFGMIFPNMPLYIMFLPIPIKAKWMVLGYGVLELAFGVTGAFSTIAHFAHLGGMIFGFFIIYYWKKKGVIGGGFYQ